MQVTIMRTMKEEATGSTDATSAAMIRCPAPATPHSSTSNPSPPALALLLREKSR